MGKSSLINMVVGQGFETSGRPGKTQLINHLKSMIGGFGGLAGYGYAQVSKKKRATFSAL